MKKIIALILGLVLLLACASAPAESAGTRATLGEISINGAFSLQCGLPEGFKVTPLIVERDQLIATITSEDPIKPIMVLSVAFDESYSDVERLNDLDDEALALLEQTFTLIDPTIEISYGETALGTRLLIAKQTWKTPNYIDFMTIYKGYFVEFVMTASQAAEEKTLSNDQIQMCIDFLTNLDFVPIDTETQEKPDIAGKTFTAMISGYHEEDNSLEVTLRQPVVLEAAVVDDLKEGSTLEISGEAYTVEKIDRQDDIIINEEFFLRPAEEGGYHVYFYESRLLENLATLRLPVAEDLVFLDDIDPDSLEMLEEPTKHTAAEFLEMLSGGTDSVGFGTDNVLVTFDDAGNLSRIERIYTPWQ